MKKYEDDIRNTLSHAKMCYEAWWIFTGKHSKREQIKFVHNNYLDFFNTLRPALYCSFVIKLSSLFSKDSKDITIKKLPNIETYPKFNDLWDRGRRFYKYRNKVIAHRDIGILTRNFAKETGFTYNDLKKILTDTCSLFDSFAKNNRITGIHNSTCEEDLLKLISDLFNIKSNKAIHLTFSRRFALGKSR